jgi:hypothetical protein
LIHLFIHTLIEETWIEPSSNDNKRLNVFMFVVYLIL